MLAKKKANPLAAAVADLNFQTRLEPPQAPEQPEPVPEAQLPPRAVQEPPRSPEKDGEETKKSREGKRFFGAYIDPKFHKAIKRVALDKDMTVQDVVEQALTEWLERNK